MEPWKIKVYFEINHWTSVKQVETKKTNKQQKTSELFLWQMDLEPLPPTPCPLMKIPGSTDAWVKSAVLKNQRVIIKK